MKILLCRSRTIGSWLIRLVTWSDWSHVAVIDGEHAIEAVWPRVRRVPLADVMAQHTACEIVEFSCTDVDAAIRAARSQIGKPYDLTALVGLLAHRDWQEDDRWFCSELAAWSFAQAGTPLFRHDAVHRITPQHLWMLSPSRQQ